MQTLARWPTCLQLQQLSALYYHHLPILEVQSVRDGLEGFPIQAQTERVVIMGCPSSGTKLHHLLYSAKGAQVGGHHFSWEINRDIHTVTRIFLVPMYSGWSRKKLMQLSASLAACFFVGSSASQVAKLR